MELKQERLPKPLRVLPPFNRTIVELKLSENILKFTDSDPFNRTIVELKHNTAAFGYIDHISFNRTIVELKRHIAVTGFIALKLLIGPLWN